MHKKIKKDKNIWLFEVDINVYQIFDAIDYMNKIDWEVDCPDLKIHEGDIVYLSVKNSDLEIYAQAQVIRDSEYREPAAWDVLFYNSNHPLSSGQYVLLEIVDRFLENPIRLHEEVKLIVSGKAYKAQHIYYGLLSQQQEIFKKKTNSTKKSVSFKTQLIPPEGKIKIAFFVILSEVWPSIKAVWERAKNDHRFETYIVILQHTTLPSAKEKSKRFFDAQHVEYFTESNFSLEVNRPHVLFYSLPYSTLYPINYRPELAVKIGCRVAYIPYGFEVGGGMYNYRYQYDNPVTRLAWRVFARSQVQKSNFDRFSISEGENVILTGHPRLEVQDQMDKCFLEKSKGRTVVLWTPHFSVLRERKWSSFLDYHKTIIELIDERLDLFLIIRPHPLLINNLVQIEEWGNRKTERWFKDINNKDNVHLDFSSNYFESFELSSALMADAGSFLVEYLTTGKPVCYLTGQNDIGLNEEARSLNCYYPGKTKLDLIRFLDSVVIKKQDPLSNKRISALSVYFDLNKVPSKEILDEIFSGIKKGSPSIVIDNDIKDHHKAYKYWLEAKTTFLAPEEYYQMQEIKLNQLLSIHSRGEYACDIGCGNGRFTEIISRYFKSVDAIDPNKTFIQEAIKNSALNKIKNISYSVESIGEINTLSTYDFVCVMGVTSGLIDNKIFKQSIWRMKSAMREGGRLLLKDTCSLESDKITKWGEYIAIYRNINQYIKSFEDVGLILLDEILIAKPKGNKTINKLFLFELKN